MKTYQTHCILTPQAGAQVMSYYDVPLESEAIARAFFLGMFAALDLTPCKVSMCIDTSVSDNPPAWYDTENGKLYFNEDGTPR